MATDNTQPKSSPPAEPPAHAAADSRAQNPSGTLAGGVGAYGPNSTVQLDLSEGRWEDEHKQNKGRLINDSPQGRLAIRAFSRGILGAAAFSWGQRYAGAMMGGYHPEKGPQNWVQGIAKVFDEGAGKPIEAIVNALGYDGKRAVTFRPTRKFYGASQDGRSLGHDAVSVTFDFAAMSVGDAIGRDIASFADPNAKRSWQREDGSIDIPQAARALATNAFRYLTYNQGEDWAVALPYVYFVRAQRNLINKFSPGFAYDSDRGLNGGSFKIDKKGNIIGNYQLEGLLDLQGRFTAYNVGTLMFREAYTELADSLLSRTSKKEKQADEAVDAPPAPPKGILENIAGKASDIAHWAARDVVKGTMYMTPAVPFFWITRTPQTKWRGLYINPEQGALAYKSGPSKPYPLGIDLVHVNERVRDTNKLRPDKGEMMYTRESPVGFSQFTGRENGWNRELFETTLSHDLNPHRHGEFDPFAKSFSPADAVLNKIGSRNNQFRQAFHPLAYKLIEADPKKLSKMRVKRDIDNYANAAVSYTPYFWSKTEFANLWDNARMDMAIDRTIQGLEHLKPGEFKAGLSEIIHTLKLEALPDPKREQEATTAIESDVSAADIFDPKIFQDGYQAADARSPHAPQAVPSNIVAPAAMIGERPSKEGFVERLQLHKKYAENRMEALKREISPSYAAAVTPPKLTPKEAPAQSFAEQEIFRQTNEPVDSPTPRTTLH